jgi:hypothetical protein
MTGELLYVNLVPVHLHRHLLDTAACLGLIKADADFDHLCRPPLIMQLIGRVPSLHSVAILAHMSIKFKIWHIIEVAV